MIRLPRRTLFAIAALVFLMLGVNLWLQRNRSLEYSATSFGVGPSGYKAAFDLLRELKIPVTRSYLRPNHLPRDRTVWFVLPDFLASRRESRADIDDLIRWIRAGGTAVVMGDADSEWKRFDLATTVSEGSGDAATVDGEFASGVRDIVVAQLAYFDKVPEHTQVQLKAAGKPFALQKKIGSGRLIAIADGRFVENTNLDSRDGSVLLIDLVRRLGRPAFDEHCHGLTATSSSLAAFTDARLLTVLALMFLTLTVWIAEQHSWPARKLRDNEEAPAPSIAAFVESLGILYSRANDPRAAFNAYRESFLRRARRRMSPRIEISDDAVLARFEHDRSIPAEAREWLAGRQMPTSEAELVAAVRAMESWAIVSHERQF